MTSRIVQLPNVDPLGSLARRIASLSRNRCVLVVACREGMPTLRRRLEATAAVMDNVYAIDAITDPMTAAVALDSRTQFLHSPVLLELIQKRGQRLMRERSDLPWCVMADDIQSFNSHVGAEALSAMAHYMRSTKGDRVEHEFVSTRFPIPDLLRAALRSLVDEEIDVGVDGSMRRVVAA